MGCGRERIRRALSVGVLVCAVGVLVATSSLDESTNQRFEFAALTFDGKVEVIEGTVGPAGELPPVWSRRSVELTVISDRPASRLLLEILDTSGAVERSAVGVGEFHRVFSEIGCADDVCQGPVTYRIQSLDGERVTIEPSVELEFTASHADDEPDVPMEAPPPGVVARVGDARSEVLASATLQVSRDAPVAAVRISWTPTTCQPGGAPRIARVSADRHDSEPGGWNLLTFDERSDERRLSPEETLTPTSVCDRDRPGRSRHSSWVVLSTEGSTVTVDVAVIGPEDHPPVRFERARVDPTTVRTLSGVGHHQVVHEVRLPGRRPDPRRVFMLALEPLPPGVETGFGSAGPDIGRARVRSDGCGRCVRLGFEVLLGTTESEPPPAEVETRVVLYEIWLP